MEVYDDNKDGKIDIREMAQLLPMEENFLLLFRFDNPLESSVEFMKVNTNKKRFQKREFWLRLIIHLVQVCLELLILLAQVFKFLSWLSLSSLSAISFRSQNRIRWSPKLSSSNSSRISMSTPSQYNHPRDEWGDRPYGWFSPPHSHLHIFTKLQMNVNKWFVVNLKYLWVLGRSHFTRSSPFTIMTKNSPHTITIQQTAHCAHKKQQFYSSGMFR